MFFSRPFRGIVKILYKNSARRRRALLKEGGREKKINFLRFPFYSALREERKISDFILIYMCRNLRGGGVKGTFKRGPKLFLFPDGARFLQHTRIIKIDLDFTVLNFSM